MLILCHVSFDIVPVICSKISPTMQYCMLVTTADVHGIFFFGSEALLHYTPSQE